MPIQLRLDDLIDQLITLRDTVGNVRTVYHTGESFAVVTGVAAFVGDERYPPLVGLYAAIIEGSETPEGFRAWVGRLADGSGVVPG